MLIVLFLQVSTVFVKKIMKWKKTMFTLSDGWIKSVIWGGEAI